MSAQFTTHPGIILLKSHRKRSPAKPRRRKGIRHKRIGRKKVELQELLIPGFIGFIGLGVIVLGRPDLGTGIVLLAGVIGAVIV